MESGVATAWTAQCDPITKKYEICHAGLLLAPLLTLPEAAPLGVDSAVASAEHSEACPPLSEPSSTSTTEARVEIYRTLRSAVEAFGLENCWKTKPLLTGKAVHLPPMLLPEEILLDV